MQIKKRIRDIAFSEISIFIFLWVLYMIAPVELEMSFEDFELDFDKMAMVCYYMLVVGINNFGLIPRYLSKGRPYLYLAIVLATLALFSYVDDTMMEFLFQGDSDLSWAWSGVRNSFAQMGILTIFFGSFKLVWDYQTQKQRMNALEKERVESELKFLKSQINPHVLFNHLNSIYYYTMEKSEKVPEMVLKLSDVMRYMLYEANEQFVPLEKEIEYIENFIELEKVRHEGRGRVMFNVAGPVEGKRIAPLLLISFIENSFKHSHQTQTDDILIIININLEGDWLNFTAVNNWSQTDQEKLEGESGIGLPNVRKRLALLYPDRHSLQINRDEELFIVHMRIKLTHAND
ncbi:sensor histidine kinase [Aliifodinibius sp. S!AR15-10]|uniref:sensor histidine kinase n=1 Tax=Aliifodinibius sp. S!AR15-10 TaxID=2950437 RepID=UPI00285E40B9|nr:sensor histidine kinase [Aliifodinibius sp. S!AR15-10]MDR8389675.1 sensor histidine kinase [Aliifodinibius sp. S!AR15-10]